jgi:2-polyprenyl-3-methyl-5-hydroxy-6-metoxy-1,4-benzoquinol methylase
LPATITAGFSHLEIFCIITIFSEKVLFRMRKIETETEIISGILEIKRKTVIDIGCGTGELVRWMNSKGAYAVGLDTAAMLMKAKKFAEDSGLAFNDFKFRSICRTNTLSKLTG